MTFAALKAALASRGFSYLTDAQLGQLINDAMHDLDEMFQWPYREASATGTAPLTIADLGTVEAVLDTTNQTVLKHASYGDLLTMYGEDLSTAGNPWYWYLAWPSGSPEVATYPVGTGTIGVQYWRVMADLSGSTDSPASPSRFHGIIVDLAVQAGYRDSDDHQQAEALQAQIDRRVGRMLTALMTDQGPRFHHILYASDA